MKDIKFELDKYIKENIKGESLFSKIKKRFSIENEIASMCCEEVDDESSNGVSLFKEKRNYDLSYSDIASYLENSSKYSNFQSLLFKYIDDRNLKDSDVYNKVNIDRRLFSKIRNNDNYHPSKDTVILLGLALELSEDELEELLESASYSLPKNNHFDLIIRFCFINGIYALTQVNDLLYEYKCKLLSV